MHVFPHPNIAKITMHLVSHTLPGFGESWTLTALPVPGKKCSPTFCILLALHYV